MSLCVSVRRQETYVREGLILFDSCLDVLEGNLNRNALRQFLGVAGSGSLLSNIVNHSLDDLRPPRCGRLLGHGALVGRPYLADLVCTIDSRIHDGGNSRIFTEGAGVEKDWPLSTSQPLFYGDDSESILMHNAHV